MTNSTRLFGLVMTAALWAGVAAAQGLTSPGAGEDLPPDLTVPSPSQGVESLPAPAGQGAGSQSAGPSDMMQSVSPTDGYYQSENCDPAVPGVRSLWTELAPIESTGTWLRRGFWYAETDAVIYNRVWKRDDILFAADDQQVTAGPVVGQSLGFNQRFLDTNDVVRLFAALPGRDAAARATLGNFLFRDDSNRDHTIEFTAQGGGEWEQQSSATSIAPNGLFVPFVIAAHNPTFNESTSQNLDYASNLSSFELNYRVRGRLSKDQLIMDANGDWHRAANGGFEKEYLIGLRFIDLGERFDWTATDIVTTGDDGEYRIRTRNDMIGYQMGTGLTFQAPRWSLGAHAKGGVFLNRATGHSVLDFTADDTNDFNRETVENQLSFAGDFKLQGKYHLLPNVSLRAAYEMMLITSAALAPNQATFVPDTAYLNTTGNPFYHGASFGCDFYW